jgi:hypothetical protein
LEPTGFVLAQLKRECASAQEHMQAPLDDQRIMQLVQAGVHADESQFGYDDGEKLIARGGAYLFP